MTDRPQPSRILERSGDFARAFSVEQQVADGPPDRIHEAYERGRNEGRAEAERAQEARLAAVSQRLGQALGQLGELSEKLRREHEARFVELALEAASRIVRERVEQGDPVAARALCEAVAVFPGRDVLKVRLHPDDLESVKSVLGNAIANRGIELATDESVGRGGCMVEASVGTIDATLETALSAVKSAVYEPVGTP